MASRADEHEIDPIPSRSPVRDPLPFATDAKLNLRGRIKVEPDDFVVEEIPPYCPSGQGEHLFLWIEKRDVAGDALLRHIARALQIPIRDIGCAGVKDRRAVTRQFLSVPASCESRIGGVDTAQIRVLSSTRHSHKLRTGHVSANLFSILIRDIGSEARDIAKTIASQLEVSGCPNFYGEQRFGYEGETLSLGVDLLRGTKTARSIPAANRRFLLRMALSAVQSALFNDVLSQRMADGLLQTVVAGDVMQTPGGGKFVVVDPTVEQTRFDRREIVLTGPMFGPRMVRPQLEAALREETVLRRWSLSPGDFERYAKLTAGTRRPLVIWPREMQIATEPLGLRLQFLLPSGAYATVVLREFLKEDGG